VRNEDEPHGFEGYLVNRARKQQAAQQQASASASAHDFSLVARFDGATPGRHWQSAAWSPDGSQVAVGGWHAQGNYGGELEIWNGRTGKHEGHGTRHLRHDLAGSDGADIAIIDAATGQRERTITGQQHKATALAWATRGTLLAVSDGENIWVLDADAGARRWDLPWAIEEGDRCDPWVHSIGWLDRGRYLLEFRKQGAFSRNDGTTQIGTVTLWDVTTRALFWSLIHETIDGVQCPPAELLTGPAGRPPGAQLLRRPAAPHLGDHRRPPRLPALTRSPLQSIPAHGQREDQNAPMNGRGRPVLPFPSEVTCARKMDRPEAEIPGDEADPAENSIPWLRARAPVPSGHVAGALVLCLVAGRAFAVLGAARPHATVPLPRPGGDRGGASALARPTLGGDCRDPHRGRMGGDGGCARVQDPRGLAT
jgi:hypothetical protein